MPILSQTDMFAIVLELMGDALEYMRRMVKDKARIELSLSDDEVQQKTSSGVPVYESRVGWGVSYLERAGLLDRIARGAYRINQRGLDCLVQGLNGSGFSASIRRIIEQESPWYKSDAESTLGEEIESFDEAVSSMSDKSPEEGIGLLENELNSFWAMSSWEGFSIMMHHSLSSWWSIISRKWVMERGR